MTKFPLFPNNEYGKGAGKSDPTDRRKTKKGKDDDDEEEEDKEPSIWGWFEKQLERNSKLDYSSSETFHTMYVRSDNKRILIEVERSKLEDLFFVTLHNDGYEGTLPDLWDEVCDLNMPDKLFP
jgi:hypothetical protein